MAFKRIVAKSEQDLQNILDDVMKWFKETKDYKVSFSKETRKFMDPESKKIVEKQIDVINAEDKVNDKRATIKFVPMVEKGEMKLEIGGEGETVVAGKIQNQMKGRGTLKSYSKDKKVALKESNIMKKSELKQLIKEEISKILSEDNKSIKFRGKDPQITADRLWIQFGGDYRKLDKYIDNKLLTNINKVNKPINKVDEDDAFWKTVSSLLMNKKIK